jgi:hypothetical protein
MKRPYVGAGGLQTSYYPLGYPLRKRKKSGPKVGCPQGVNTKSDKNEFLMKRVRQKVQGRMARGSHGLPKASPYLTPLTAVGVPTRKANSLRPSYYPLGYPMLYTSGIVPNGWAWE